MSIVLVGSTSGSVTLQEPAVAGTSVLTLPVGTGTAVVNGVNSAIVSGTAVSASSTSVDFTSIPSWVKRITVMFNSISTNGGSNIQIQIGSGSVNTSGYNSTGSYSSSGAVAQETLTTGFALSISVGSGNTYNGIATICLIGSNIWTYAGVFSRGDAAANYFGAGISPTLSGTLDRVRITTVNGTDAFDAGTINILYE